MLQLQYDPWLLKINLIVSTLDMFERNFIIIIRSISVDNVIFERHALLCYSMSRLMGNPTISRGENKDADQLRGNREADQRLCFRYSDSTIPLLLISKISSI